MLALLILPCAVSPTFTAMYEDYWDVLPLVTVLALNSVFPLVAGFVVLVMLAQAFLQRSRLARPALLAWSGVMLGVCCLLLYVFGILAPTMPL